MENVEQHWHTDDLDPMHNADDLLMDGEIDGSEEGFIRGYMAAV